MIYLILFSIYASFILNINTTKNLVNNSSECAIAEFYEAVIPQRGTKVLTRSGNIEDAEIILVKSTIEIGNYDVNISRKGRELYKLEGTVYYLETRYCYEYATYEKVILKVESNYAFTKGHILF